jgi:NAD(P)H-dependent flavin oxidoreductase YrpB (nitropropane dioxygenase family)
MTLQLIQEMPRLIQAGMGIHISSAKLANSTSRLGALGVVSGAALRHIILEDIRANDAETIAITKKFPIEQYVEEALSFMPGGKKHNRPVPVDTPEPRYSALPRRLSTVAAFVEVMRAKRGHGGKVGINVMWKCPLTVLPTIYGAMLAGVDALLCGAGVPMELPDIVARIRAGQNMEYLPLTGTETHARMDIADDHSSSFLQQLKVPTMIPILSNFAFAKRLLDNWEKKYSASPFAFVLENHAAGGHNAPPRNKSTFSEQDDIETYFDKVLSLEIPIYAAGNFKGGGTREEFQNWISKGAYGLQIGSRFALCEESGMREDLRKQILEKNQQDGVDIKTDMNASPTGYPIKIAQLPGTISDEAIHQARKRVCNKKYLVRSHFQEQPDGSQKETYICAAMSPEEYSRLGGDPSETEGKVCLCNGLLSTAGYYQEVENAVVTLGEHGKEITHSLHARDIVEEILTPEYVAKMEAELIEEEFDAKPVNVFEAALA